MPDIYQVLQGGQPQGGTPVPPEQPISQGARQPVTSMGMPFQQRPVGPLPSSQVHQQQPLRPVLQPTGRFIHQRPTSDPGSPQSQRSDPSFQVPERVPQSHEDIIPDEFGRFIEVSDLTAATFTEDKYYQYLSKPITIRFEKIQPRKKYDSAGVRVNSTWLNCTRSRLPSVDVVQADEEIQRLNRRDKKKGLTLMKKQQSLGPNAQTQLTKAERDLSAAVQDRRFNIILKQLDWTEGSDGRHRKGSRQRSSKKPREERNSITAYFSRCPKPNQVPSALYRQLEMEKLQTQTRLDEQDQERETTARRARETRARDKREHEEKMAEQKVRQEEAMANQIREQRMMSQQQQQRPTGQQMPAGQPMYPSQQAAHPQGRVPVMQHQPGPEPHRHPQSQPTMAPQQMGPLPQGYVQGRPPMAQQQGAVPQQHPHFPVNNGLQQGRRQPPPNAQGMPPPGFRQMVPPQGQQGPPPNFRQMPPHPQQGVFVRGPNGEFIRQPANDNRPIITVVTEHEKLPQHRRDHSQHPSPSSDSGSGSCSVFDSDSERSSARTKRSSLASGYSGSPRMARAFPTKPKKPNGGAGSRYIVDSDDDFARDTRPPITRRHHKAYIQTGSERNIEVPRSSSRGPSVDPLTQVREAYLAGHADRERLVSEVNILDASAMRYQPPRRLSRSDAFSEVDGLDTLPKKYQFRRLSRSDTQSGHQSKIFQDGVLPKIRRISTSEVGRELNRERARDFDEDLYPRDRFGTKGRNLRYDDRDLEHGFAARFRLNHERLGYRSSVYDDLDLNRFRERQRQRESFCEG